MKVGKVRFISFKPQSVDGLFVENEENFLNSLKQN